jgi:single-strand DNA-binding protein
VNLNRVVITGNLTADPESFNGGCQLRVAVNGRAKENGEWVDRPDFLDVVVFGKLAEVCAEHLAKGRPVAIDGKLRQDRWQTEGGDNRSRVRIVAESVQFLSRAREEATA